MSDPLSLNRAYVASLVAPGASRIAHDDGYWWITLHVGVPTLLRLRVSDADMCRDHTTFRTTFDPTFDYWILRLVTEESLYAPVTKANPPPVPADFGSTFFYSQKRMGGQYPACTICLVEFKPGEKIRTLHTKQCSYHKRCLQRWLVHHNTCPNCGLACSGIA